MPLLAPDVPVVTWWHGPPPDQISQDPLGVVGERRITDCAQAEDPCAALAQRAADYAGGDTDLAWTRTTPWRTLVAGALDPGATGPSAAVTSVTITAPATDASAALLRGWLAARLGVEPRRDDPVRPMLESVRLGLADGGEISIVRRNGTATMQRTGQRERTMPLTQRSLGEELAEELRRLNADQSYARALSAATAVPDLTGRPATRVHTWVEPAGGDDAGPAPAGTDGPPAGGSATAQVPA
jgi:glucose-6-phosphate dehydrogenase assembly protein OpcA